MCGRTLRQNITACIPHLFGGMRANVSYPIGETISPRIVYDLVASQGPLPKGLTFDHSLFILLFLLQKVPFISLTFLHEYSLRKGIVACRQHGADHGLAIIINGRTVRVVRGCVCTVPSSPCLFPVVRGPNGSRCKRCTQVLHLRGCQLARITGVLKVESQLDACATHRA